MLIYSYLKEGVFRWGTQYFQFLLTSTQRSSSIWTNLKWFVGFVIVGLKLFNIANNMKYTRGSDPTLGWSSLFKGLVVVDYSYLGNLVLTCENNVNAIPSFLIRWSTNGCVPECNWYTITGRRFDPNQGGTFFHKEIEVWSIWRLGNLTLGYY